MASRGTRKGGTHRMDGAIAALTPLGFSKKLIRDTIKELLQVYGDNDAGWYFVEENYYKLAIDKIIEDQDSNKEEQLEMALGDESPRRCITTMFDCKGKKLSIRPTGFIQGDQGQGQTDPPVIGVSSPPPGSEYQSSTEQGQEQTNPPVVRVPPHAGYFPTPTSTNPLFPSLDQTHSVPFSPYYPSQTSQTVPSTYPYPPYHHLYYYPPHVLPKQGGPSIEAEVGAGELVKIEDKRVYIEPEGDTFNPARLTTHKIRDIIRSKYVAPYLSWKKIPKDVRDMWFREFQKDFRWLPEHGSRIRTNFEKRGSTRLRDMFTDIRKSGKRPLWIGVRVWDDLTRAWASPEFTILREQNKQNRASDCGGLGSSLHTGGSIPYTEHRRRLKVSWSGADTIRATC